MNRLSIAQSQADSLEIYDPFTQREKIDYILDTYFVPEKVPGAPKIDELINTLMVVQKQGDKLKTAYLLKTIAESYLRTDNNNLALQYFFRSLSMAEETGDIVLRGLLNLRIGAIYPLTESPFETDYMNRGIEILKNINDDAIQAVLAYARARDEANPAKADSLTMLAITLQRRVLNKNPNDTTALENLSKYLNGISLYNEAIATAEKAGSTRLLIIYINNRGMLKYLEKKYSEALPLYLRALKLCKEARMKGLMKNTYHNLSMLYAGLGDYKKSARYLQLHALTRENQLKENNAKHYIENIVRYEVEAREMANAVLKFEKNRLEKGLVSARVLETILVLGLCFLAIMLGVFISGRNKLKNANSLLNEQKNEIDKNRKQLELAHSELQESEANLNAAQELAQVANWEWNISESRFSFSEMMPKLFGFTKEEFASNNRKSFLSVIHPDDRERISKVILEGISNPGEYENSFRIVRGEEIRWLQALYKYVIVSSSGKKIISGTVQDITLMKEREEDRIKIETERMFASELIAQQEAERKRIAFEIHDGIGQDIVALKNQGELALTDKNPEHASVEYLQKMVDAVPELLQSLRRISRNLHPVHLERMGLTETIQDNIRRAEQNSNVCFTIKIENIDGLLPAQNELHIYRIVQEVLSNIQKHSGAKNVVFDLWTEGGSICLVVHDDGMGFNIEEMKQSFGGYGLHSIESRVRMLGADLSIESDATKGTSIHLTIPLA